MEMKLEEAQICRLCGECESIYIDVFGEEGTKRFLGVKIHTKINILIDETDPLPKAICVQCLGKLEFVCDFQEECLRTQQVLRERYNLPPLTDVINEADGLSHRVCLKCIGALEFLCDFQAKCHKTQETLAAAQETEKGQAIAPTEPLDVQHDADFDKENTSPIAISGVKRKKSTILESQKAEKVSKHVEDKRPKVNIQGPEKPRAETKLNNNAKAKTTGMKETRLNENKAINVTKSHGTKMNGAQQAKINKNIEANVNKVGTKKPDNVEVPKKTNDLKKTSSPSAKSDDPKYSVKMESGFKMPSREGTKITDWLLKKMSLQDAANAMKEKCDKGQKEISVIGTKEAIPNNQHIEVIVKVENHENMGGRAANENEKILNKNKIVFIPNLLKLPEILSPKSARPEKLHGDSPPRGDEAENEIASCSTDQSFEKKKEGASMELARKSVIEKAETEVDDGRTKRRESRSCTTKKLAVVESEDEGEGSPDESDEEANVKTRKFGRITDLISEEQKEAIEKSYSCDMSAVDEKLVMEQLIFLDSKKFGCKLCDATYTRQDKCQVHIWAHLDMRPYRCNACEFSTVTVSNIRCHVRKSHLKIKPYACDVCEKRYVTSFLLEEHLNTHTGSRPYGCDMCEFTSASRQVLSYHKTTHKPVKDITCHFCDNKFYSKSRLRAHLLTHNKDKAANMCKLCSIYLCNSEALQKHYANVHNKLYKCNFCEKTCKSKKALNNHQNVHLAAKYKCTLCSSVYKSSHILKEHLLKHEGIRKYKCNVCQKDFAQQSHLAAHMAVHSDKRFLCPGCKRPFNRHDNMKMHTKRCDAFLANPELAALLTARRSHTKSIKKDEDKAAEDVKTVSLTELESTKTDTRIIKKIAIVEDVPKTRDECRENFTTVVIENTIPCT